MSVLATSAQPDHAGHRHGDGDDLHRWAPQRDRRGTLLHVSDVPITPEGVKTDESDSAVTRDWTGIHLDLGIEAVTEIATQGEPSKHFRF